MKDIPSRTQIASRSRSHLKANSMDEIYAFLESQRGQQGGFRGKGKESDLYYTAFALDCFLALGKFPDLTSTYEYVSSFKSFTYLSFIELCSLLRCLSIWAWVLGAPERQKTSCLSTAKIILAEIEEYRTSDGGYSLERKKADAGSLYGCFFAYDAYQNVKTTMPQPGGILDCLERLRTQEGAYVNDRRIALGNAPATAAASVLYAAWNLSMDSRTKAWLWSCQHPSGGFLAFPGVPLPDLLSTAVVLYALRVCGEDLGKIKTAALSFIEDHWGSEGGFFGTLADTGEDCEYTFYGLLALGSLMS